MSNSIIIQPMTAEEARDCINDFNRSFNNARVQVLDLYERRGWEALGYGNWRDCVQSEFLQSQAYLYRLLAAAKVERNISPIGEIGVIPESQLRPLTSFDSETQRNIWEMAKEKAPEGKVTASHIEHLSREYKSTQEEFKVQSFEDWSSDSNPPYEVEDLPGPAYPLQSQPMKALTSSKNDSWRTPSRYIEAARLVLGRIDLDPASSDIANETVKAATFFTKEDDALNRIWVARSGNPANIFLNPPYGKTKNQSNQGLFAQKLLKEYHAGNVGEGILLVNLYVGYDWWNPLRTLPMCLVGHRISFINPDPEVESKEANASSVFIYVGKDPRKFYRVFKQFGPCGQFSYDWE